MNPKRPLLTELMLACHTGACNSYALINSLAKAMSAELRPHEVRDSLEVQYIIGHIGFQTKQTIGPAEEAFAFALKVEEEQRQQRHNQFIAEVFPEQATQTTQSNEEESSPVH